MPPLQHSDPYPWPYDAIDEHPLDAGRIALLCIAFQPAFARATVDADRTTATAVELARVLQGAGAAVVPVCVGARVPLGRPSPLHESAGAPPPPEIAKYADAFVESVGIDGFYASTLEPVLRQLGRDRIVLCGLGAESAVDSTLRSANDRGFECLTLTDAVSAHDPDVAARAHASVTMSGGIFGALGTTADLLDALAHHPEARPEEGSTL